ncbi:DEAD/DEAH box helicase [Caldalkalibacillus salinus]|uniref:DEAD/DEAH box helicase n=1 Tax=Caldalkalibacillus salinus TaxID=2803787 RepID=UPI001F2A2BDE|nr:DEAD/DEAH box helicase [Caldalkalibacillus salinus]
MNTFHTFGLKQEVLKAIKDLYFKEPTPIQEKTVPLALEGKDLIGQAQTGTGKTAAFVIPILEKIDPEMKDIQALIMTPTRELAIQITEDIRDLSRYMDVHTVCLHGGRDIQAQINKFKQNVHIVVGTPGRILDHLQRETLHFGRIHTLVLDEADKMLEMGFQEEVELIIANTATQKQTLLFSATMPDRVKQLAHRFMHQPPHIRIGTQQTSEQVRQYYYVINQSEKADHLKYLVEKITPFLCIVFVNTQKRVELITHDLQSLGLEAKALHGGFSQNKRERIMKDFRDMKFQYLVCTDIAARGLDVEGVTHVINFDLPSDTESYIHRVGRTGRANEEGVAISFVSPKQKSIMRKIESAIGQPIEERILSSEQGVFDLPERKQEGHQPRKRHKHAPTRSKNVRTTDKDPSEHQQSGREGSAKKGVASKPSSANPKQKHKPKKVKPGYKKKIAMEKKKQEQKGKRKRIQQQVNERLKKQRRQQN